MTKKEVNEYLTQNAIKTDYKADILTREGHGQTIGAYHNEAKKQGVDKPTQKWHFTVSYYENIKNVDAKPTYYRLHCPELLIWIAEVSGLNDRLIDETIDFIKRFENGREMRGKDKGTDFFYAIEPVIKDLLRMDDINNIIKNAENWDEVIEKVNVLKKRNVPRSFKAYARINEWNDGRCDETSEKYYEKIAALLNCFDIIEPENYVKYGITQETCLQEMMEIYVKNNRVSNRVANNLIRLMEEKVYPLGAEYGFLGDLIKEVFTRETATGG